jgi:tetratricopeptide (TPR) repeat protein
MFLDTESGTAQWFPSHHYDGNARRITYNCTDSGELVDFSSGHIRGSDLFDERYHSAIPTFPGDLRFCRTGSGPFLPRFREALRIQSDFAFAHYNIADSLARMGRMDEAVAHFREARRLNPDIH